MLISFLLSMLKAMFQLFCIVPYIDLIITRVPGVLRCWEKGYLLSGSWGDLEII